MHVVVRATITDVVSLRSSELEHVEVVQALGEHTRCRLHFTRDSATDLAVDTMLGQPLRVTVEDEAGVVEVFDGVVTAGRQTHQLHAGSVFQVEGTSRSLALDRRRTTYFRASTVADVAQRLGASFVGSPRSSEPLEFVQFGESDFDFLRRLADEQGMFVRTNTPTIEVRSAFDNGGLTLVWGRDLLSVTASCDSANNGVAGAAHLVQEKRDHRFRGVAKEPAWLGGGAPLAAAATRVASQRRGAEGDGLVEELPFRSRTLEAARTHLEQLSVRALGTAVRVDGEANNPRVRAGDTVTLEESDAFTLPTRGALGVVQVTHRFDGQLYRCDFTATPWMNWTNAARPVRATIDGPTTGMVVDNVDPQRMGRLKVRLRWHDADESTRWLRMAMPYSGNTRGLHFLPEIGDEVLVAFELGDPERPIIVGALWNGKDVADTSDANTAKRIVTRSGNTIQFYDDDPGNERIELFSATGQTWVQLANNGGKPLLTIHSEGDIALEARNEIRLACRTLTERIGVPPAGPASPWTAGQVPKPATEKTTADARSPHG
jgi:type VI secretion system secreted protein VgrG